MNDNLEAYEAGKHAHNEGAGPLDNPHTPAPPGDPLLASLWRIGWRSAKYQPTTETGEEK